MKISIVTDELSADPETAIELGVQWGVQCFELRGYFNDRVPLFSHYQRQHLRDVLDRYDARIIAIGPGLFKMRLPPPQPAKFSLSWMERTAYEAWTEARRAVKQHLNELLPRSIEYASELGAEKVVIFGFDRGGAPAGVAPDELLETLSIAAQIAHAAGIQLVLENEAGFWADTGARTAAIVQAVNHPGLAINWDPGNAFFAGDCPYPNGYQEVRNWVRHVHVKDARRLPNGVLEYVGEGQIDWPGQIQALMKDGFEGFLSVETHLRPKIAEARASVQRLHQWIDQAGEAKGNSDAKVG
ncbi:MAG: sugar phosphate isomerase/epimerase [Anaerolineales bacterium]